MLDRIKKALNRKRPVLRDNRWSRYGVHINAQDNKLEQHVQAYVTSAVRSMQSKVVGGAGIKVDPLPRHDGEVDTESKKIIESYWSEWCTSPVIGSYGLSIARLQAIIVDNLLTKGEVFIYCADSKSHPYSDIDIALQIISSDGIQSIERDKDGNISAYNANYGNLLDPYSLYHIKYVSSIDSDRGQSMIEPALPILKHIATIEEARKISYANSAPLIGFFEQSDEHIDIQALEESLTLFDKVNGSAVSIPFGVKFTRVNADGTNNNATFQQYRDGLVRLAAGIIGIPASALSGDYTQQNYSSLKKENNDEKPLVEAMQSLITDMFLRPLYRRFIDKLLYQGIVKLKPNQTLSELYQATYNYPVVNSVDEYKEAKTLEVMLNLGLISKSEAIKSMGKNPEEVFLQRANDAEKEQQLGIQTLINPQLTIEEEKNEED